MSDISSETTVDFRTALDEFEAAWESPKHTGRRGEQRSRQEIHHEYAGKDYA